MSYLSRRMVLVGLVGSAGLGLGLYTIAAPSDTETLTPVEAFEALEAGDILLVDIRRPDEWERTGIATGAVPIDMRRDDFIAALQNARQTQRQPVALICARGVRSANLTRHLTKAGLTQIVDIPEGMLGSFAGPGWLKRGLPVRAWGENS